MFADNQIEEKVDSKNILEAIGLQFDDLENNEQDF